MTESLFSLPPSVQLRLYNTQSRQLEAIFKEDPIRIYTCGPTVYNFAHIGNFRTYIFEDLLRRTIQLFGMQVVQAMNLTDVDDKTIRGALQEGLSLDDYTQKYKQAFFADIATLGIEAAEFYPQATDYIQEMIALIEKLIAQGYAYTGADGSIYFAIEHFPHYGKLSHLKEKELQVGASKRVASDEYDKEHAADFVLWKKHDPERDGTIFWPSPFGPGRPGWHIECSAMAMAIFGETIDIHMGGVDNIFPHHENEIAQSEACTGKCFAKHWIHAEHLLVDQRKMSKSAGNFYTLRDLLEKGYSGLEVRYLLMQGHYRMQLNFTLEGLEAAKKSLTRLHDFIRRLKVTAGPQIIAAAPLCQHFYLKFSSALGDDLNLPQALASLFDFVREIHSLLDLNQIGKEGASLILKTLQKIDAVLNVLFPKEEPIPQEVHDLLEQRQQARLKKEWKAADLLRDQITAMGFIIEDSPDGPRLKKV